MHHRLHRLFLLLLASVVADSRHVRDFADPKTVKYKSTPSQNVVVLLTCSDGFFDMWTNWLLMFERLAIPNLPVLFFGEDEKAYEKCLQQAKDRGNEKTHNGEYHADLTCLPWDYVFSKDGQSKEIGAFGFRDQAYKKMMAQRPAIIHRLLKSGLNIIFSDVDVVWRKNPIPYFHKQFKNDHGEDVHIIAQPDGPWLCAGFVIYRFFPETIAHVDLWRKGLEGKESRNQLLFNDLIKRPDLNIRAEALPSKYFPDGISYFHHMSEEERNEAVVVHNNFVVGYRKKVQRFKKFGLWVVGGK